MAQHPMKVVLLDLDGTLTKSDGGIIASVVNTIGAIGGKSPLGVLIFIGVFLFGHSINIGINALGAYVHGNRLQYVEFFGKFYEGGGRPFKPFSMKMKHYKLKEDK